MKGIGKFNPPDKPKHKPLDSNQTELFYQEACNANEVLEEISGRIIIDMGFRNDELVHIRPDWIGQEINPKTNEYDWYVDIPQYDYCIGGAGKSGPQNRDGINLHTKGKACNRCSNRTSERKTWVTDEIANKYDFHPKTINSPDRVWFPPDSDDLAEKLNAIVNAHDQFPILHSAVNRRLDRIGKRVGISRKVTAHALRHTYGARLASMDYQPMQICYLMRHEDLEMSKWYCQLRGVRKREVMKKNWDSNAW